MRTTLGLRSSPIRGARGLELSRRRRRFSLLRSLLKAWASCRRIGSPSLGSSNSVLASIRIIRGVNSRRGTSAPVASSVTCSMRVTLRFGPEGPTSSVGCALVEEELLVLVGVSFQDGGISPPCMLTTKAVAGLDDEDEDELTPEEGLIPPLRAADALHCPLLELQAGSSRSRESSGGSSLMVRGATFASKMATSEVFSSVSPLSASSSSSLSS